MHHVAVNLVVQRADGSAGFLAQGGYSCLAARAAHSLQAGLGCESAFIAHAVEGVNRRLRLVDGSLSFSGKSGGTAC